MASRVKQRGESFPRMGFYSLEGLVNVALLHDEAKPTTQLTRDSTRTTALGYET